MRQLSVALAAASLVLLSACTTRPVQLKFPEGENLKRDQQLVQQTRQIVSHPSADMAAAKRTLVEASAKSEQQADAVNGLANCDVSRSGAEHDAACVKAVSAAAEVAADNSLIVDIPDVRQQ